VLLDLGPQGFGPSGHSSDDPSSLIGHGTKTHVFECSVGGKGGSFSIRVVHCIYIGGCKEGVLMSDGGLLLATPGLAFLGSPSGFGLS
jgi:hypothetical protein